MKMRISVTDAAKEIGCNPQLVRMKMQSGEWDLGEVVEPGEANGKQFYAYLIFRPKLDRFLGKEGQGNGAVEPPRGLGD